MLYQEGRLRDARLEVELRRRAQVQSSPEAVVDDDDVAAKWANENLANFGDELLSLLLLASQEAARLGQVEFSAEAVLLGFLASPGGIAVIRKALPHSLGDRDPVEIGRGAIEVVVQNEVLEAPSKQRGPDLPLTPTLRKMLEVVEAERARLGQDKATPAHLLLTLTGDYFAGGAVGALQELGVDPKQLRLVALASLGNFLASAQYDAEEWLLRRNTDSEAAALSRLVGQPMRGLGLAFATITDGLVERSVEAKLMLLAALAGEHLFLLGLPGTGKSLVARRLSKVCAGSFFERLLTRFSVPEEIFGPLSLQALEQDELRRKTRGYLPEADVAFIDEIFKANSSILNTLLMILNDRFFDNGELRTRVPLWCVVAASNELPDTDELDALYDRFLLRRCVRRISAEAITSFLRMALDKEEESEEVGPISIDSGGTAASALLSAASSAELRARARDVEFPEALLRVVSELREYLAEEAEPPYIVSDRRLGKAVRLIRVSAAAVGAPKVVEADLLLLRHMFWDRNPEQGELVAQWLFRRFLEDGFGQKAWTFLLEGLRKMLRTGLQGPALDAARRDLSTLRESATRALEAASRVAQDAPPQEQCAAVEGHDAALGRFFWLSADDRREMAVVGDRASQGAVALGELLVEASVLSKVANEEEAPRRQGLLAQVIGSQALSEVGGEAVRDEWGDPI